MHLVDVATRMQLAATGQVAACVPFLYQKKLTMTIYKGEEALQPPRRRGVETTPPPSCVLAGG